MIKVMVVDDDPMLGARHERLGARIVVAVGGLGEAEHARGDEVLARDPVRAATRHPHRDPPRHTRVLVDQAVARLHACGKYNPRANARPR